MTDKILEFFLYRASLQVKAWEARRRAKGIEPNADATWDYINRTWPEATEQNRELIFQSMANPKRKK